MLYDEVLRIIGEFGPYQKRTFAILCFQPFTSGLWLLISIFTLSTPDHRCAIPGLTNDTFQPQNDYHRNLINQSIPESSKCLLRNQTIDQYGNVTSLEYKCTSWVYDQSTFTDSLVTEFNLVCDDEAYKNTAVMTLFLGLLIGYVTGNVADHFGRKPIIVIANYTFSISAFLLVWTPNYIFLLVIRFFLGLGMSWQGLSVYNLGLEIVGPNKRLYTGVVSNFTWVFGILLVSLLGYNIRTWRYLHLSAAILSSGLCTFKCLIPESPRWLLTTGKEEKARAIIAKAAKQNKVMLSEDTLSHVTGPVVDEAHVKLRFWKMFTSKILLLRTTAIYFNWFTVSVVYYGIILNLESLVGNIYLNLAITAMSEGIVILLLILITDKLGRRPLQCVFLALMGSCLMAVIFILMYAPSDLKWLMTLFTMIGQFGSNGCFAMCWLWTGELYPTELRNFGVGTGSSNARVATVIAPYFGLIKNYVSGDFKESAPFIIYVAFSLTAFLLTFFILPETTKRRLPETIDDCKKLGQKQKKGFDVELEAVEMLR